MANLAGKKVLFFVDEAYEELELWYPKIRLEEEGATTVVAGAEGKSYKGKNGYPCRPDISFDKIEARQFDAVVIPGGFAPDKLRRHNKVLEITRDLFAAHKPVAFICHAGWVPISAKILKGKNVTGVSAIRDDLENAGATYHDRSVVIDGNLISSRTPKDLPDFCRAIIDVLQKS